MSRKADIELINKVEIDFPNDYHAQRKEFKKLIEIGEKERNQYLVGAAYYHLSYIDYCVGDNANLLLNALIKFFLAIYHCFKIASE